ncbi:peroxidase [Oleiphilus sp. HI0071]|uniref:peroxidase family protein n=2 Tax=Oleiphilus TaxID=141450 RepID=UPI0007C333D3|nr:MULTISPECIES: peroxidase family protein [unclassified Oleiphilus]KZY63551.1 peroxidase [Oleiphilus sp. HI0065]KZY88612.1 peroxidase [Oleiphilus sp. HI0071]KZY97867.1 peroxidase [Oleiphilus sp. HI0073]KZZ50031.1 peroxidase [Oleiphilus sp. HI0122]KZZ54747.1 peroxidase [Oleiphilus sp. HI0118]KZZ70576.1 peroxidase [Oleiphilus sp. HI0130]KZZ79012.1 peroxidase [Oleiphilus sp. HI0133]
MFNSVWVTWPALAKLGTLGVAAAALSIGLERTELLENNMIPTEDLEQINSTIVCDDRSKTARTEDGTCNILENPAEGSVYRRFGRNVQLEAAQGETEANTLLTPNPREISNSLMAREEFKPATSINFIAAAWIQFMVHDWVSHGANTSNDPILVQLPDGDPLGNGVLEIERTTPDLDRSESDADLPPTYRNVNTHWWDGSQLYGSDKATSDSIRSFDDGKLIVESDGTLPNEFWSGVPITGFNDNWWLGLSMMHQLFTLEHNAIAERLKQTNPEASDQWLYDRARLVNSALMAKIHTVEWTPALLQNPALELSMESNWWGITRDPETRDTIQNISDDLKGPSSWIVNTIALFDPEKAEKIATPGSIDHILGGLVGQAKPNNYGVPYSLTEEFVAVYRMHPLLRDAVDVYDIGSNIVANSIPLENTRDGDAEDILVTEGGDRLWYSFGITNPGSLTLNNYPEFLRNLSMPLIGDIDLATIDIIRDRERGIPRYNEFRRQIGLNPITKFEDLTTEPTTLAELKRIYNNDIEQIDALVGQLAETIRPDGFAFGETAFQVFILNASRRLMTDRFFTESYTPEVYTQDGIDWVESNTMIDVIRRHFPTLDFSLTGVENAFKPWDLKIPEDYKQWAACDKESLLWTNGAQRTEYEPGERPDLEPVDIGGLIDSVLWEKVNRKDDVAPLGYEKPIHAYGSMATVAFEATDNHPYTGVFKGAECGLLRLSVTGDPNDRGFAPGLAWKVFVDGKNSRNVSALFTLSGQDDNHDFFLNELSNYVDKEINETLGTTALFSLVSTKPTTLSVGKMAKVKADGSEEASVVSPTQIYFVPRAEVKGLFESASHDFRDDLELLPVGTPIYDVYATSKNIRTSIFPYFHNKYARDRRSSAVKVGTIKSTSEFNSSSFGDGGVFFRHQRVEDQ